MRQAAAQAALVGAGPAAVAVAVPASALGVLARVAAPAPSVEGRAAEEAAGRKAGQIAGRVAGPVGIAAEGAADVRARSAGPVPVPSARGWQRWWRAATRMGLGLAKPGGAGRSWGAELAGSRGRWAGEPGSLAAATAETGKGQ